MRKLNPSFRGFTLIELLVVISIIAILSSIVLAAVSGARSGATTAAGQLFAGNTLSALYSDALVYYTFDGATLSKIPNLGSSAGTESINSSMAFPSDTTLHNSGNNLTIPSGISDPFILRTNDSSINNAYASGNYTFSFWFKPIGSTSATPEAVALGPDGNGLTFAIDPKYSGTNITGIIVGENSNSTNIFNYTNINVGPNQWTHIAISVENVGPTQDAADLYINGALVATNPSFVPFAAAGVNDFVLGGNCCGWSAGGYYDDVEFFGQTLLSANIQNLYDDEKEAVFALQ